MGVHAIYYPCMSFNFDEHLGDNHYNCPVVAYYPETIAANMHHARRHGASSTTMSVPMIRHDFPEKMTANAADVISAASASQETFGARQGSGLCCPGCLSWLLIAAEGRRDH